MTRSRIKVTLPRIRHALPIVIAISLAAVGENRDDIAKNALRNKTEFDLVSVVFESGILDGLNRALFGQRQLPFAFKQYDCFAWNRQDALACPFGPARFDAIEVALETAREVANVIQPRTKIAIRSAMPVNSPVTAYPAASNQRSTETSNAMQTP